MSLPKEPRQKMINIMYLFLTAMLALNISAEILNAFKTVNRSLENTNSQVNLSTETIMKSLEEKKTEAATAERANIWFPKASQVVSTSQTLYDYIESLKNQILTRAGGKPGELNTEFDEGNQDIVTKLMINEGNAKKLLDALTKYKADILGIDSSIKIEFEKSLNIDLSNPPGRDGKTKTWEIAYFNMVPTVAGLTILSKFQNDIKTSENKVVAFCHTKVGEVKVIFDTYTAIVGQNSNYLMPGQDLEIKAGVGAFSKAAQPTISIGGSNVAIGEEGYALYKTQAGGVGSHSVPVRISFFNQTTGKEDVREVKIDYVVGSANASIALDKMNVLYIGVNNPVTIAASGGGDDKVNVSITGGGGSISKVGAGKYIVKVSQQSDDCRINVSVDGKVVGAAQFRVRQIPGAQATVGGFISGENIAAGTFRAQGGVAAWIKDFPFDLKYTVTQFTISTDSDDGDIVEAVCTGNAFSPNAMNIIRTQVKAGKTVYIDNIRVQGEDGQNKKAASLVYYIK
mgnify:FL=1